jgi:hypothetical protein
MFFVNLGGSENSELSTSTARERSQLESVAKPVQGPDIRINKSAPVGLVEVRRNALPTAIASTLGLLVVRGRFVSTVSIA